MKADSCQLPWLMPVEKSNVVNAGESPMAAAMGSCRSFRVELCRNTDPWTKAVETAGVDVVASREISLELWGNGQLRTDIGHRIERVAAGNNRSGESVGIAELGLCLGVDVSA